MIVTLPTLKLALGITGTGEDAVLEQLEAWATEQLENLLEHRLRTPKDHVEVQRGSGADYVILEGHLDDPIGVVTVRERLRPGGDPEDLTAIERRGDYVYRTDGLLFNPRAEYEFTYQTGYSQVPGDLQKLIVKLVGAGLTAARAGSEIEAGEGGITGETIGDYSYTLGGAAAQAAQTAIATFDFSEDMTFNRWRRQHI